MADTFYATIDLPEVSSASAPSAGQQRVYGKPDGHLYAQNSSGQEFDLTASGAPVGTVYPFRFASTPTGYLALDGATYNVDDYPELGALYGGFGGGTFQVDDWRNLPLWGAGTNAAGVVTGSDTVDLTHSHTATNAGSHNHGGNTGTSGSQAVGILSLLGQGAPPNHTHSISSDGDHTHAISSALGSTDIKPRRAHALWIIKAF